MDYDFITTCNWTATGTYTLRAQRSNGSNIVTTISLFYRKKGDSTWIETTDGTVVITSTGEWEIGNHWNKSGNDCLNHIYYGITAIDKCTDIAFNETTLGSNCGDAFLYTLFQDCSNLASMPTGFNIPDCITTVGDYFLYYLLQNCTSLTSMPDGFTFSDKITTVGLEFMQGTWYGCSSLTAMPSGFNLPSSITTIGNAFLQNTWRNCTSLKFMPSGFNLPQGITNAKNDFLYLTWMGCTALKTIPSGFSLPSSLTSAGTNFMKYTWMNCTALDDDGYTENLYFKYAGTDTFGGTCTLTSSPSAGSNIAVNRPPVGVRTQAATDVEKVSFTANGNITDIGSASPTTRGFCYKTGTTGDPTTSDSTVSETGTFSAESYSKSITGLTKDTSYRVRAYATNADGTGYGETITVTTMAYDFITTCNWTETGTYKLMAFMGLTYDEITTYYDKIHYRKKGTTTWTTFNSSGEMVVDSTGEWEVGNDWNKSGNDCLNHSYADITKIDKCTAIFINSTSLGTTVGNNFLRYVFGWASNLESLPDGFNIPSGITTIGNYFLHSMFTNCTSLTAIPEGFQIPTGITSTGSHFLEELFNKCTLITEIPEGFQIPTGITTIGNAFLQNIFRDCTSLTHLPIGFNIPQGITAAGDNFLYLACMGCTSLETIPSGFSLPSSLTSAGANFMKYTWMNCTALDDDGYTEDLYFKYAGTDTFGGTCTLTSSPSAGSSIAVNRGEAPTPPVTANTTNFFLFFQ